MNPPDPPRERDAGEPPLAAARAQRALSLFWLIPLVAALVGGWLGWEAWSTRGTEITMVFTRGEGIEQGRTVVRYKAVEVGRVIGVSIAPDLASIEVRARINRDFAVHLTDGTRFWVVRPRVAASGVSGLSTLVSGAYIEVDPAPGEPAQRFTGLETPPIVASDAPGREFVLRADELRNVQPGSSLAFRDIDVGEVLGYELSDDGSEVAIHVFVREPYTRLVRENSRFWLASGLDLSIGADGVNLRTSSLQELVIGGIEFDSPPGADVPEAAAGARFELYPNPEAIAESHYTQDVRYVLYFDESVRGLASGAPVEFRGIKLGEVAEVGFELDAEGLNPHIPVVIAVHPQRLDGGARTRESVRELIDGLIAPGLRARLQTGNLLTAQLYVDLVLAPESPATYGSGRRKLPQIPTLPTEFGEFKNNVNALLAEFRRFPLADIGARAARALENLDRLLEDARTAGVLRAAGASFSAIEDAARTFEAAVGPLRTEFESALAGIAEGSPLHARMNQTLRQVEAMARALRELADVLEREPASVIWGREPVDE